MREKNYSTAFQSSLKSAQDFIAAISRVRSPAGHARVSNCRNGNDLSPGGVFRFGNAVGSRAS